MYQEPTVSTFAKELAREAQLEKKRQAKLLKGQFKNKFNKVRK